MMTKEEVQHHGLGYSREHLCMRIGVALNAIIPREWDVLKRLHLDASLPILLPFVMCILASPSDIVNLLDHAFD